MVLALISSLGEGEESELERQERGEDTKGGKFEENGWRNNIDDDELDDDEKLGLGLGLWLGGSRLRLKREK